MKQGFLSKLIIRRRLLRRAHFMRKVITREGNVLFPVDEEP